MLLLLQTLAGGHGHVRPRLVSANAVETLLAFLQARAQPQHAPAVPGYANGGRAQPAAQSDADAKKLKTEDAAVAKMRALHAKLARHCSDDSLVKGWEVERRTCNGKVPPGGAAP